MTKSSHFCQTKTTLSQMLVIALFCTENQKKYVFVRLVIGLPATNFLHTKEEMDNEDSAS